jgi:hypothetical protein
LPDNFTAFALTLECSEVGNLDKIKTNRSTTFLVPKTERNLALFEFSNYAEIQSNFPYTILRASYYEDTVPIFEDGHCYLMGAEEKGLRIFVAWGGIIDFEPLKKKSLRELNFEEYVQWGDAFAENTGLTDGEFAKWMYLDFGLGSLANALTGAMPLSYTHPCVIVGKLFDQILADNGMALSVKQNVYESLYEMNIPLQNLPFTDYLKELAEVRLEQTGSILQGGIPNNAENVVLNFALGSSHYGQPIPMFNYGDYPTRPGLRIPFAGKYKLHCTLSSNTAWRWQAYNRCDISARWKKTHEQYVSEEYVYNYNKVDDYTYVLETEFEFEKDQVVQFRKHVQYTDDSMINASYNLDVKLSLIEPSEGDRVPYGSKIDVRASLPDIKQMDLIKTITQLFGLFAQRVDGSLRLFSLEDVAANVPYALDWSDKLVTTSDLSPAAMDYTVEGLARTNSLKWKEDDTVPVIYGQQVERGYGDGAIVCENENLPASAEFLTVEHFAATTNYYNHAIVPCYLQVRNDDGTTSVEFKTVAERILLNGPTEYKQLYPSRARYMHVPYFSHDGNDGLSFNNLVDTYFGKYRAALRKPKLLKVKLALEGKDISTFDFETPVYLKQYGQYYFVKKINNYVAGKTCIVELLKLEVEVFDSYTTVVDENDTYLTDNENNVITL